jgi:hypothetical protein
MLFRFDAAANDQWRFNFCATDSIIDSVMGRLRHFGIHVKLLSPRLHRGMAVYMVTYFIRGIGGVADIGKRW